MRRETACRNIAQNLAALMTFFAALWLLSDDMATLLDPAGPSGPVAPQRQGFIAAPTTLGAWTEALAESGEPGPRVCAFTEQFDGGPAEKMAAIYARIARDWHYEVGGERDSFISAEVLAQPGMMKGNCVHIAAFLYASSTALGVTAAPSA